MLRRWNEALNNPMYVFIKNGKEIGGFSLQFLADGTAQVWSVRIYDAYKDQGYGKMMMKDVVKLCRRIKFVKRIWLNAYSDNAPALACYRHAGFTLTKPGYTMVEGRIDLCRP